MKILGISAYYHDSAAVLLIDGEIMSAVQEERFTRVKNDYNFPVNAINFCLNDSGIDPGDIDYIVYYDKPLLKLDRLVETHLAFAPRGFNSFSQAMTVWLKEKLFIKRDIRKKLDGKFKGKILFTEHHESHAASAFFPSPFEEAAILTVDGVGEWATASIGKGKGNRIEILKEMMFPHSLGLLYSAFTYFAGFRVNSGEYKLMGLAPYGRPVYADIIKEKMVDIYDDGSIWLDMSYFNYCAGQTMTTRKFDNLFGGAPRNPESRITQREMDIAASIQKVTDEIMIRMSRHAQEITGCSNLCLAGGVALNCVANGKIMEEDIFDKIWIQPAAGDAGGALGAAMFVWHQFLDRQRKVETGDSQMGSLLGTRYSNDEIKRFLDGQGSKYEFHEEDALVDRVADYIRAGKVIGWFYGKMEFGPRSLGARSIIGDARSKDMQAKMNLKIKYRESFRPFAPCVLAEDADKYFEFDSESPYMLIVAQVKEDRRIQIDEGQRQIMTSDPDLCKRVNIPRSEIPAVTHIDYSARIQTVDKNRHGRFYEVIRRFKEKTGCPVIINTSFNIRGEPIVCSPADAFRCFMNCEMDVLVLENFILRKEEQSVLDKKDIEEYKKQFKLD